MSQRQRGYSPAGDNVGLLGLQPVINNNKDQMSLALGFDLNSFGLNLVSNEFLHPTLSSPWTENPPRVQPEYRIPQCYLVSPPALRFAMFQRFQLETLFYIFYSMPRDVLQLAAAQELHNRDWRFHREMRLWFSRPPNTEPSIKTSTYEKGTYIVFNPEKWAKEKKEDFVLMYDKLEDRAQVNQGTQGGQAMQTGGAANVAGLAQQ